MPVLEKFNPRHAVLLWIKNKEHRCKETPKARDQKWYNHIFEDVTRKSQTEKNLSQKCTKKTFI